MTPLRFAEPWWFVLLPLVLVPFLRWRRAGAVVFSDISLLDLPEARSWRWRLRWLPDALWGLALGLFVATLARPQIADVDSATAQARYALQFVVDASGSMGTVEVRRGGEVERRLDQAKAVVRQMVESLPPATKNALVVGLLRFADIPQVVCPLTRSRRRWLEQLEGIELDRLDHRTAIGDALALALEGLSEIDADRKDIVLVTDGAQTVADALAPATAARIAEAHQLRIFVVAVGSPATADDPAGFERDRESLRAVARISGGSVYEADRPEEVASVGLAWANEAAPAPRTVHYPHWEDADRAWLAAALLAAAAAAGLWVAGGTIAPEGEG